MALDLVQEHDSMLSKCGSFWYETVNARDKAVAHTFNGMACHTGAAGMLADISEAVLSGGYFAGHNKVLRFKDSDISYNGADKALQALYNGSVDEDGAIVVQDVTALSGDGRPLADEKRLPVIFPNNGSIDSDMVLPANYRALFGLKVDDDIRVSTIELPDGGIMVDGTDFVSEFGMIWMQHNPTVVFPEMKLTARSYVRRARNLYCYPLRLDNIYGPVDRVMRYYREFQSPKAFRLAAAQACGLAVTSEACRIVGSEPLLTGTSYYTGSGRRLDAPYPHNRIHNGTVLPEGYIIGEGDLFDIVLPADVDDTLPEIHTYPALPEDAVIQNKTICAKCVIDGTAYDRPVDCAPGEEPENDNALFSWYWELAASVDGGPASWESGMEAAHPINSIDWVRQHACGGNSLVVRINSGSMPYDMQVKLHNFIDREAPIGCLLTYSPITSTILED